MIPSQGEIVLIPVPFTDLSSQKRRPVIIISNTNYNQISRDMLIVAVTSNPVLVPYSFPINNADLVSGQLNKPSVVRADKVYVLAQTLIVKHIGVVKQDILERTFSILQDILSIPNVDPLQIP